jgi:hypothetical protein
MSKIYPKLKFGEITVQYEDSWINQAYRYFNYDTIVDPTSNIVFLYHDNNEVTSTMDIPQISGPPRVGYLENSEERSSKEFVPDKAIVFSDTSGSINIICPHSITIPNINSKLYRRSVRIKEDNTPYLPGFKEIYSNKYNTYLPDPSIFNCIYYIIDTEYHDVERVVFSLMKRKYGINSSRFLFSYDPEIMTKHQVQYIIYIILTSQWK